MTGERKVETDAEVADRIFNSYKEIGGRYYRYDLLGSMTGNHDETSVAIAIIPASLVPIYAPAKTNNPQPIQDRPSKYHNTYYNNELPGITPLESHFIDCLPNKTTLITTTLLSNLDGAVTISPLVSVDRTNVGKASNPNNKESILLPDTSSLGGEFRSLSPMSDEARVESLKPATSIFVVRSITIKDLQVDDSQVNERLPIKNQIEPQPLSCYSVYTEYEATSEELPQNAQTEEVRKTAHGEQLQTTPPAQNRQPTPPSVPKIFDLDLQVDGGLYSAPNPSQQSEKDNSLQTQLPEQSPENHTETEQAAPPVQAEQAAPPVQAEQTAETEQIAPPAQIRQPTPPTVSEIDEEELYTDMPLEASEQKAQADPLQTQPATQTAGVEQTAETKQNADEVVYDDIPLASEQTAQVNLLITQPPESKVDVSIPNQTAQPATQTAGAEQTGGTGQIMPPAPDEQVVGTLQPVLQPAQTVTQTGQNAGTLQPVQPLQSSPLAKNGQAKQTIQPVQPAQASLGYAGQVNPEQVGGTPSSLCVPMASNRADNSRRGGCFSSCTIS